MTAKHYNFNEIDPTIEKRVDDLMVQMTLREKVLQMSQICIEKMPDEVFNERVRQGVGSALNSYGVERINSWQKIATEETRLGIPLLVGNDVIHGYRTIFPIPLAESCTWDPDLLEEAALIAAEEASSNGVDWTFAPMVDICRDARWGRIAEGAGEDPYLGRVMAEARVKGFQGVLRNGRKLTSCPKHYVAYGAAEDGRDYNTVDISERTLRDVYLPPFKAAFDAGAGTVMSSFNEIAGVPSTMNAFILRQILRYEMGFNGLVLSDWNAVGELVPHGVAADLKEAAMRALQGGVDMDMTTDAYENYLEELEAEGAIPMVYIDDAVRRILRLKFMLGLFENPYRDEAEAAAAILTPEYREKALEVAQKSMVLLKNEGDLLPISPDINKIALIGPLADDHHEILGCWYRIGEDGDTESVLDGFRQVLPNAEITHVKGCDVDGGELDVETPALSSVEVAVSAATQSDIAILVLGEAEQMSGEAHSRAYLDLPGHQQALLEAVYATGTPVVLVLMSGRPLTIPWAVENVPAILQAWHGGIRTGRAVADLLTGAVNPSGKLTVSWPRTVGQVPIYYAQKATGRPVGGAATIQFNTEHFTAFIDESNAPQYPFGYGLSYTTFAYDKLTVETPVVGMDESVVVTAVITNTGTRTGTEIAQLYVRDLVAEVTRPVRELKGFQRITLKPGESQTIRFTVPVQELGFHGLDMQYKIEPGQFHVWIGQSASNGLQGVFEVY